MPSLHLGPEASGGEPFPDQSYRCGRICVVGRPNVGKSTLINRILGQKLSITSRRAQTTRHAILGIKTTATAQAIYVDTPGMHHGTGRALNRYMSRAASHALTEVDLIVFMIEAGGWQSGDDFVLKRLETAAAPVFLALNKVDRVNRKQGLLPMMASLSRRRQFAEVIPLAARKGTSVQHLEKLLERCLPLSPPVFKDDEWTDRSEKFLTAELVREQLIRRLGQEVPHRLSVTIERFERLGRGRRVLIHAVIWVERSGQKAIVIGQGGLLLKQAGTAARKHIGTLLGCQVHLELWVKVRQGWSGNEQWLKQLGYGD